MGAGFDPKTCITAGDLRWMGISLPEDIPDCAWVKRSALQLSLESIRDGSGDRNLILDFTVQFEQPLQWISMDLYIEGDKDSHEQE
jgi:hypothetical protein